MEIENLLTVTNQAELRAWLAQNHKTQKVC